VNIPLSFSSLSLHHLCSSVFICVHLCSSLWIFLPSSVVICAHPSAPSVPSLCICKFPNSHSASLPLLPSVILLFSARFYILFFPSAFLVCCRLVSCLLSSCLLRPSCPPLVPLLSIAPLLSTLLFTACCQPLPLCVLAHRRTFGRCLGLSVASRFFVCS